MPGWPHTKRLRVENAFFRFLDSCFVDSKDDGHISLGKNLYDGQIKLIHTIFDALEEDIHKIYILKSRQLGISTIVRAVTTFMLGVNQGLSGALVFDTAPNRENARKELVAMIKDLPLEFKFPKVKGGGEGNREGLSLENGSKILFMSAGVKKSKSSGTLGRSVGLAFATLSELCSYDNDEGLESFEQSLSEINPDRLYIYESTARGFNLWHDMWTEAKKDTLHCKCIFLGWWSKPSQRIDGFDPDYDRYGLQPPTELELEKIQAVKDLYGHEITPEQLAWVRRKYDPTMGEDEGSEVDYADNSTRVQEQAWTEHEAFQNSGSQFFPSEHLNEQSRRWVSDKYQSFMFTPGAEFSNMLISGSPNPRSTELKIWEDPDPEGVYVFGVDPAFGENELNDRSSIEILRCYADGVDQVGEYACPLPTPQQLAWVLAAIMGWYGTEGGPKVECRYILELNGPGNAVLNEMKQLRFQLENGYFPKGVYEKGIKNIFQNIRSYIYSRPDSMSAGQNIHWKTNLQGKIMIMNHIRDYVGTGTYRVRSDELVEEMRSITQEGDTIKAPGAKKDDRVLASALALYYWQSSIRKGLIQTNRTREAEMAKRQRSIVDTWTVFNQNKLNAFFEGKRRARVAQKQQDVHMSWRYRR